MNQFFKAITLGTAMVATLSYAEDDAMHSAKGIAVDGGSFVLDSADDALHSDTDLTVKGGNFVINSCYEGLEAVTISIDGGNFDIHPTDDGVNANGEGLNSSLTINDGHISIVNADGKDADGLDSNGNITINGGDIYISLGTDGGNNALDYGSESGGVCVINGGTVIACASSMMLESVSDTSAQGSITKVYNETQASGTTITLKDASGNVVLSKTIDAPFTSATLSSSSVLYFWLLESVLRYHTTSNSKSVYSSYFHFSFSSNSDFCNSFGTSASENSRALFC